MKTKRPIQILTVLFALGLLGAYIVYSQNKQTPQTVMPGSKSKQIDWARQELTSQATVGTNNATDQTTIAAPRDMTVMSSSKVIVPVVSNPPATAKPATSTNLSKAVIYGSKSAPAFVPSESSAAAPAKSNAPAARTNSSATGTRKP